jgi:hypothetical protein
MLAGDGASGTEDRTAMGFGAAGSGTTVAAVSGFGARARGPTGSGTAGFEAADLAAGSARGFNTDGFSIVADCAAAADRGGPAFATTGAAGAVPCSAVPASTAAGAACA